MNYTGMKWDAISGVLRAYRKAHHLTQQEVADYLGVERTTYVKYETTRRPGIEELLKLAVLYQIPFEDFFKIFFENEEGGVQNSDAVAGKSEENHLVQVTNRELRLLNCYRNSLRKAEIMKAAEEIFNKDNEIFVEEINDI